MHETETKEDYQKYLDPKVLSRIARLDIKARQPNSEPRP